MISKSGDGVTHVAPSEKPAEKATPEKKVEQPKQKVESAAAEVKKAEKPKTEAKASPPPPKVTATEPQLPPKERERRVSP